MQVIKLAIAAVMGASLTGCGVFHGDYATSYAPGMGCFIVGWGDQPYTASNRSSSVYFQGVGSDKFGAIKFSSRMLEHLADGPLFTDADGHGVVTARYVPAGMYELYEPTIHLDQYPNFYTFKPKERVSVPFSVKSGECTYVGRFLLSASKQEFVWLNRKDADLKVIAPSLPKQLTISSDVVTPKSVGHFSVTDPL